MKKGFVFFNFFLALLICSCRPAQQLSGSKTVMKTDTAKVMKTDSFLFYLMARYPQYFDSILKNDSTWKVQVIYTRIDRNGSNSPTFTTFTYNVNPSQYYYPASTVKLPVALLALQKLNQLKIPGLDKNTTMITEAAAPGQTAVYNDPTTEDGRPAIAQYIRKIFLVSDNDAFNRLYEFLGQEYINNSLHAMGYDSAQIVHRLQLPLTEEQYRTTNPVVFYNASSKPLYTKPLQVSRFPYHTNRILLGKGYMKNDSLVEQPFDFSRKNRLNLPDLHSILTSVIFPDQTPQKKRFNLTSDDYAFVRKYMSMMPRESLYPSYDSSYEEGYSKLLMFGGKGKIEQPGLRIFNKEGDAYGFLTDAAYIIDKEKGIEFILCATIRCNSDGIFNDDKYDYDNVGLPFLKNLGRVIYDYEAGRERKHKPDLSAFDLDYR